MKFTFNIDLRRHEQAHREKLIMETRRGEGANHLVMKLLAYLLFLDERPLIEADAGWHYRPDLVTFGDDGSPDLWVDCGTISLRKIENLARKSHGRMRLYIVRKTPNEAEALQRQVQRKVPHADRVQFLSFDSGFVPSLASALDASNDLAGSITDDRVQLTAANRRGQTSACSRIHRL